MPDQASEIVILALESSADLASAAVWTADGRQVQQCHAARHGHAALITDLAQTALAEAGITAGDITHVAAGRGPGSFTGIRVALAAAKGFALATGAVGMGVSCLATTAHAAMPAAGGRAILATADTRRGGYFAQMFASSGEAGSDIEDIDPETGCPLPPDWHGALVIGAGAEKMAAAFAGAGLQPDMTTPRLDSLQVARLAASQLAKGAPADPLVPLYVAPAFLGPKKP